MMVLLYITQAAAAGKADATTGEKAEAAAPTSGDDYTANAMTPSTTASSVAAVQKLEPMLTLSEQVCEGTQKKNKLRIPRRSFALLSSFFCLFIFGIYSCTP
jgi:hypothetical protein